ncbi:hypothetical protein DFJ74DRAFT_391196 [Hyaloraphidium curvatum]|nr:hypothetical protein DFJ74DRAFT_391196 [Hyaloraphidium curvatum]
MAFLRRLIAQGSGPRALERASAAYDPFAPDPNDAFDPEEAKEHPSKLKSTWTQWFRHAECLKPSRVVHQVLRVLDVVVSDANGGGASILPVVNEGFVKTPFPRKTGTDGVEDFMRIPVRKSVKDGIVRWRPNTSLIGLPPHLVSHRIPKPYVVVADQVGSLPLLDAHSPFVMRWDMITIILLIWTSILTPFEVAFLQSDGIDVLFLLNRVVDFCFLFDIMVQFCTAYHDPSTDTVIRTHKKIAMHYIRTWFFVDLVSTIPFELIVFFVPNQEDSFEFLRLLRVLRLTRLLKLLRVLRANRKIKQLEQEGPHWIRSGAVTAFKYIFTLFILSHWFACAYKFVSDGHFHPNEDPGWAWQFRTTPTWLKYMYCFHYGALTVALSSPSAHPLLYPRAEREYVLTGIMSLISLCVVLYLLPSLTARASVKQRDQLEHEHHLSKYSDMLSTLGVRKDKYGSKVVGFWEERRSVEHIAKFDTLLRALPDSTRALISIDLFAILISSLPYITPFVATDLSMIVELSSAIRIRVWSPNQLLWESGGCDGVYFLQKGVVGLDGTVYVRGDTIGTECMRKVNPARDARCLTFVTAHVLPREALEAAIAKRPWVEDVVKQWTAWKVFQIYVRVYTRLYFQMCKRGAKIKPRPRLSRRGVGVAHGIAGVKHSTALGSGTLAQSAATNLSSPLHSQSLSPGSAWSSNSSMLHLAPLKEGEWDDIDEMVLEWIHQNGFGPG